MNNRIASRLFGVDHEPVLIGHFEVIDRVGAGGIGVVYRAVDPTLDREVAIKLLQPERVGDERERARLLREAKALARLSHPNVVQLFEVGKHEDGLFLAMEYVRGESLRRWQARTHPSWRELVLAYAQAGRGLAVAHEADLVHRDFKPDNCVIDGGGRVRVLDFGLVRGGAIEAAATVESASAHAERPSSSEGASEPGPPLTSPATVLGTLGYMPLQQLRGRPVDARADQFSFCASLYEALYGELPYEGETAEQLVAAYEHDEPKPPPKDSTVPSRLRQILLRGLALEPESRWPSMPILLGELDALVEPKARRWLALGLAVGMVGIGTGAVLGADEESPCEGARAQLEGVWDDGRRQEVQSSILGTESSYAPGVWARVEPALDEYADAWVAQRTDACQATTVREEQSTEIMDLRMACLDQLREDLAAVTATMASADVDVVTNAHEVVDGLRPPARCASLEVLRAEVEPPSSAEAEIVSDIRRRLGMARVEREAGRLLRAQAEMDGVEQEAEAVEYEPIHMQIALERGQLLESQGHYSDSEQSLRRALGLASRWHQWRSMHRAATALMRVIGVQQQRAGEALQFREVAAEIAGRDASATAEASNVLAAVFRVKGEYEHAEAEIRRAIALREAAPETGRVALAQARLELANILYLGGDYERAGVEASQAVDLAEQALGAEHPDLAKSRNIYVAVLVAQGKLEQAEQQMREIIALQRRTLGDGHPDVARSIGNLGIALLNQGKFEAAEMESRRALALRLEALGPSDAAVAESRNNLAVALQNQYKLEEAEAELREALAVRQDVFGSDHPLVGSTRLNLAEVLVRRGLDTEAVAFAELAWARNRRSDMPKEDRAMTAFVLARALWSNPHQHQRARGLAEQAREIYAEFGEQAAVPLKEIDDWLAGHLAG